MEYDEVLAELQLLSDPAAIAGMARFGINPANCYGISMVKLRKLGKKIGKNDALATQLWHSGIHEGRILACLIDEPKEVTEAQLETWVKDFDSWDVCDQCCSALFQKTLWATQKAVEWSQREEEFVKRAGFVMMAQIAVHHKKAPDSHFEPFFPIIKREATDSRNFVKKAANWALRQIGKRNLTLNQKAIEVAEEMAQIDNKTARWIAKDALRELKSDKIQQRLRK